MLNTLKIQTVLAMWIFSELPQFMSVTVCIRKYNVRLNFYHAFLQVLYMHIVIMYNNIYYNLTYIATASAPYIYGLEKNPNELEYTKQ